MPNNSVWLWKFILQLKNEPPLVTVGAGNKACLVIDVWNIYHSTCIWLCFDSRVIARFSVCLSVFVCFLAFFSVRLLSVLRGHSVFSSPPQRLMTSDFEGFLYQILSITLFSYLNSWKRASISLLILFYVECQTRELLVPFL